MRWILIIAALSGALSVMMGAATRHLGGDAEILQTALRYHQLHSVALLALGLFAINKPFSMAIVLPAVLFTVGIVIFSGSLYALSLLDLPALGYATPVGGMSFILGWLSLIWLARHETPSDKGK